MSFSRIQPAAGLEKYINCYWIIEDEEEKPVQQKIIPDGYPEVIFHSGDAYRIQLYREWQLQEKALIAGQIRKFFFLETTGRSSVFAVKFQPAAVTHLFGIEMDGLTDKVIPIRETGNAKLNDFQQSIFSTRDHHEMIRAADKYFLELPIENPNDTIDQIINHIIDSNGDVTINALVSKFYLAERQFQRLFRKYV